VPLVLLGVAQKVAVKLLDMVFVDGNVLPGGKDGFHDSGIASYFLLVAALEFLDFQVGKQSLDLAVGQLAALDAGGGADAFDGGSNASKSGVIWMVSVFSI
jgi:hypothetical protein